jgi:hypothetical protein
MANAGTLILPGYDITAYGPNDVEIELLFDVEGSGFAPAHIAGDCSLSFDMSADLTQGTVGTAGLSLSLVSVVATGIPGNTAEGDLDLSLSVAAGHRSEITYQASLALLPFVLDAYATQSFEENYRGVVLNLAHQGVSEYAGLSFNSMCRFNGVYLAADSNGIHALDAERDEDEAIEAELHTGITNMGTNLLKRVTDAYLGVKSDGNYEFLTFSDDNYQADYIIVDGETAPHIKKQNLARGIKSKYWGFGFRNSEGSDFELQSVRAIPQVSPRRK